MQAPIVFYQTNNSKVNAEVTFLDESFWLTQKAMAQFFNIKSHTITHHLKEIFKFKETSEISTTRKIRVVLKILKS